jgi:histone H3/H4
VVNLPESSPRHTTYTDPALLAPALDEIRLSQSSTELLLCRSAFQRLVREVALQVCGPSMQDLKFRRNAMLALQEAAEAYLISTFESK